MTQLTAQLCEVDYPIVRREAYRHGGAKDALGLKALLPIASDEEIRARWRKGLCATGWASCSTLAQLGSKWNDLAAPDKPAVHDRDKADGADVVDWVEEKRKTDAINERQRAWRELREQRPEEP